MNTAAHAHHCRRPRGLSLLMAVLLLPAALVAQQQFQGLYKPSAILKNKVQRMTIDLYQAASQQDSTINIQRPSDYQQSYWYDAQGRPARYEATETALHLRGTAGPHVRAHYTYTDRKSTRLDSSIYAAPGGWQYQTDAAGRPTLELEFAHPDSQPTVRNAYIYDLKGRLDKIKTTRRAPDTQTETCEQVQLVYDVHTYSPSALTPQEMARCQQNLEYYDVELRPVRRIIFDRRGSIAQNMLFTYDRTGKPVRVESLDAAGKVAHAWLDVGYAQGGLAIVEVAGHADVTTQTLEKMNQVGLDFVLDHWADWRLLREVRIVTAGRETARYIFRYDIKE